MKGVKLFMTASVFVASIGATADSYIRVINQTDKPLQALWQAGGCTGVDTDWEGDSQYTVCNKKEVAPRTEERLTFGLFMSDRSVKVFDRDKGRIGYCNSMDDSSVTVSQDQNMDFIVNYDC